MIQIVCYTGGTCGDLISAIIDPTDAKIVNNAIVHSQARQKFKKPHLFVNTQEKTQYLESISKIYKSIPSHDLQYHLQSQHKFITITVDQFSVAKWAAERFKKFHRPSVWNEMQKTCGADTVERYAQVIIDYSNMVKQHTTQTIRLERILNGHAIADIKQYVDMELNDQIYESWLQQQ